MPLKIVWTDHARRRRKKRRLSKAAVEAAAREGLSIDWWPPNRKRQFRWGKVGIVARLDRDALVIVTVVKNKRPTRNLA